jgi:hypothetical protein
METQLMILGVDYAYAKESGNPAQAQGQAILDARGKPRPMGASSADGTNWTQVCANR